MMSVSHHHLAKSYIVNGVLDLLQDALFLLALRRPVTREVDYYDFLTRPILGDKTHRLLHEGDLALH